MFALSYRAAAETTAASFHPKLLTVLIFGFVDSVEARMTTSPGWSWSETSSYSASGKSPRGTPTTRTISTSRRDHQRPGHAGIGNGEGAKCAS